MNPTFTKLAPRIMADLMRDIPAWDAMDAAAVVGNAGHESSGFTKLQEMKPVVKGSRGGWGWFQWTGPRRKAFEKWADAKGLMHGSYEANYGFLLHELRGSEAAAIPKTAAATGLRAKTEAFELAFERAGVKHYDSRHKWARSAWLAWEARNQPAKPVAKPTPTPAPKPPVVVAPDDPGVEPQPAEKPWWEKSPVLRSVAQLGAWVAAGGSAILSADWKVIAVLAVVGGAVAIYAIRYQTRKPA